MMGNITLQELGELMHLCLQYSQLTVMLAGLACILVCMD